MATLALVGLTVLLDTAVALEAIAHGKDGVITGACCAASSAIVSAILIGGLHRHQPPNSETKGGDNNG